MKKILLMPDSFKGTISANQFCSISEKNIKSVLPNCKVISYPMADGGEGTVDCFLMMEGFEKINVNVKNAYMEKIETYYAKKGETAVIESAKCVGLPMFEDRKNPGITTTYGIGEMILSAVESGCKNIIIGLGGSCTNDAGVGMAAALGVKFFDYDGNEFLPVGFTLEKIKTYSNDEIIKNLKGVTISAMCDIDNKLCGNNGAAFVFAPQKGADEEAVKKLDKNLKSLAHIVKDVSNIDYSNFKGSGAAGGMGFGVLAFLGGSLESGVNKVLDLIDFENVAKDCDLIITGEGKLDTQSLKGKTVIGISRRAKKIKVPVIAVVGDTSDEFEKCYDEGVNAVFTTNMKAIDFSKSKNDALLNLENIMYSIVNLIKIFI